MPNERIDLPQGTLDLLILKTVALEPQHGWAISERIQQISSDVLQVQQGSLYPALHRLERRGWIEARWGASDNNRRAKFYELTRTGRKQLEHETVAWRKLTLAVGQVLDMGVVSMIRDLRFRLRALFRRHVVERELDEELRFHVEHQVEKLMRAGETRAQATRQALASLGGIEPVREECRQARGVSFIESVVAGHQLRGVAS